MSQVIAPTCCTYTSTAHPHPHRTHVGVQLIETMPLRTVSGMSAVTNVSGMTSATLIFGPGYGFQMVGSYAASMDAAVAALAVLVVAVTKMIDCQPLRNGPGSEFVSHAMSKDVPPIPRMAVAIAINRAPPEPAPIGFVNLCPEPFFVSVHALSI